MPQFRLRSRSGAIGVLCILDIFGLIVRVGFGFGVGVSVSLRVGGVMVFR
jgi:hypothetical protein